ncbi:hypothetical protein [Moorena producens]
MGRWGIRSVFPIPDSRFPIPDSRLPILCTFFKVCDSIEKIAVIAP